MMSARHLTSSEIGVIVDEEDNEGEEYNEEHEYNEEKSDDDGEIDAIITENCQSSENSDEDDDDDDGDLETTVPEVSNISNFNVFKIDVNYPKNCHSKGKESSFKSVRIPGISYDSFLLPKKGKVVTLLSTMYFKEEIAEDEKEKPIMKNRNRRTKVPPPPPPPPLSAQVQSGAKRGRCHLCERSVDRKHPEKSIKCRSRNTIVGIATTRLKLLHTSWDLFCTAKLCETLDTTKYDQLATADYNTFEEVRGLSVTGSTYNSFQGMYMIRIHNFIEPTVRFETNEEQLVEMDKEKNICNSTIPYYLQNYRLKELEVIGLLVRVRGTATLFIKEVF
ncbi:hypothetical protein ANN_02726 [Periplaneta americana]|uniref:Uncharacterized protein n=1 Tax=Periplaneta americana TaxID=6978 RepID=A0ABQ8U0J9_PERAM|nr:hypothetical protein ANN_02726 [Periplaneta americana]